MNLDDIYISHVTIDITKRIVLPFYKYDNAHSRISHSEVVFLLGVADSVSLRFFEAIDNLVV